MEIGFMAKKPAAAAAPAKAAGKKINRSRRNALMRKCLSKTSKRLYMGSDRSWFRTMLAAEMEAKRKQPLNLG